jgi:hypothetical protein
VQQLFLHLEMIVQGNPSLLPALLGKNEVDIHIIKMRKSINF